MTACLSGTASKWVLSSNVCKEDEGSRLEEGDRVLLVICTV